MALTNVLQRKTYLFTTIYKRQPWRTFLIFSTDSKNSGNQGGWGVDWSTYNFIIKKKQLNTYCVYKL